MTHYVVMIHLVGECSLITSTDPPAHASFAHKLNHDYVDDMCEIHMSVVPHMSHDGWISLNADRVKCIVRKIVAAHELISLPMVSRGNQRAILALAMSVRWLPRDILREIRGHLPVPVDELFAVFRRYVTLKYITGLYVTSAYCRRARVSRVHVCDRQMHIHAPICVDGHKFSGKISFTYSIGCESTEKWCKHRGPHFCANRVDFNDMGWESTDGFRGVLQFEVDDVVEFVHKRLSKRLPSGRAL